MSRRGDCMSARSRRTWRKWLTTGGSLMLLFAITLPVQALSGSLFESGDGNLVVDGGGSATDWATAPNRQIALDKPTGQQDDSFGNGTKEDTAVPTVVDGSIPNNKSDLTRFYVANEKASNKDFLYLAWERVQEPSGTTNMDFEFNQSKTLSSNGITPVRTAGDVLIKYDLSQGGTTPTLGFHRWTTSGTASQVCEANNSLPCWGKVQALAGNFEGAINTGTVTDPIPPNEPRTLSARTFGEAAINLTDSGIFPAGQCTAFGKAYLKSRSSDSFTAAVKDFVAPIDINVSNCGGITIHKNADPDGGTDFAYTTTGGLSPATFSLDDDANNTLSNTQAFTNTQAGTYTIAEADPTPGFDLTNIACTVTGSAGTTFTPDLSTRTVTIQLKALDTIDCTFTNTQRGSITIVKDAVPNGSTDFVYTVGGANPSSLGGFSLDDDSDGTLSNTQTFNNVKPGSYTFTETDPTPGFDLTGLVCTPTGTGTTASGNVANRQASITIAAGGSASCTFTNTQRGSITIVKNTVGGNDTFAFTGTGTGVSANFTIQTTAGTGSTTFNNLAPGSYSVTETGPQAGWQFTDLSCSDEGQTGGSTSPGQAANISLQAGESVTCTFSNTKQGSITIVKNTVGGNDTFAFTGTGTGVSANFTIQTAAGTGSTTFNNLAPGSYSVTETGPQVGWQFTSLICGTGGVADPNNAQKANITVPSGGDVTCTFTNTKQGSITIVKNTSGGNATFAFTGLGGFDVTTTGGTGQKVFDNLAPGSYSVSETGPPTGWQFTDLSCSDEGQTGGSTSPGQSANISLQAGESVTCTFTNTKQGSITIVKNAHPDAGKDFSFSTTGGLSPSTFNLDDDGSEGTANDGLKSSVTFSNVPPGDYDVTEESAGSNWDLTGLTCETTGVGTSAIGDEPTSTASITLGAGGSATCTFVNTQRGSIVIEKADDAGDALDGAEFTLYEDADPTGGTEPGPEDDTVVGQPCVTVAGTCSFTELVPGEYWVVETDTPDGYETAAPQNATVDAGEEVTLTFENVRLFKVIVLVCKQSDDSLYASHVTFGTGNPQTSIKGSDLPASLSALESDICGLGGATLEDVTENEDGDPYDAAVTIPKQAL